MTGSRRLACSAVKHSWLSTRWGSKLGVMKVVQYHSRFVPEDWKIQGLANVSVHVWPIFFLLATRKKDVTFSIKYLNELKKTVLNFSCFEKLKSIVTLIKGLKHTN